MIQQAVNQLTQAINDYALSINPDHEIIESWLLFSSVRDIRLVSKTNEINYTNLDAFIIERYIKNLNLKLCQRMKYYAQYTINSDYARGEKPAERIKQIKARFMQLMDTITEDNQQYTAENLSGKVLTVKNVAQQEWNYIKCLHDYKIEHYKWINELIFYAFGIKDAINPPHKEYATKWHSNITHDQLTFTAYKNGNLKIKLVK